MRLPRTLSIFILLSLSPSTLGQNTPTVQQVLASDWNFSAISALISARPQILTVLSNGGTFFVPTNDAIQSFQASSGTDLSTISEDAIVDLLSYHTLPRAVSAADLRVQGGALQETGLVDEQLANLAGSPNVVFASAYGSTGQENSNGVGELKIYSGVGSAASVVKTDMEFQNGVIHGVDKVLNLPLNCSKTAERASLTSFWDAAKAANLSTALNTSPKVTCFSPSNQAFQQAGLDLTKLPMEQLANIIKYHSIIGEVQYTTAVEDGKEYDTLLGLPVTIHKKNEQLFVNDAPVEVGNIITTNGVAHVLNGVLTPPNATGDSGKPGNGARPLRSPQTLTPVALGVALASLGWLLAL